MKDVKVAPVVEYRARLVREPFSNRYAFSCLCSVIGCCQKAAVTGTPQTPLGSELSEEQIRKVLADKTGTPEAAVRIEVYYYRCRSMVDVINGLRHLGKAKALDILSEFATSHYAHDATTQTRVICICRILFVPPKDGWTEPWMDYRIRVPNMARDSMGFSPEARSKFPLYPMVISDGVPFLLNMGYSSAGTGVGEQFPNEAKNTIERCGTLDLIPADLPTTGFVQAAQKLIDSDAFKGLLQSMHEDEPKRSEFLDTLRISIMRQADRSYYGMTTAPSVDSGKSP